MTMLRLIIVVVAMTISIQAYANCRLATGTTQADKDHATILCNSELLSEGLVNRAYATGGRVELRILKTPAIYFTEELSRDRYLNIVRELTKEWHNACEESIGLLQITYQGIVLASGSWAWWIRHPYKVRDVDIE